MHIFSELLDRKSKPRQTELDFQVLRKTEQEPVSLRSPLGSLHERIYVPSDSLLTFNVREHYRQLKEQSRLARNSTPQERPSTFDRKLSFSSVGMKNSRSSKITYKPP